MLNLLAQTIVGTAAKGLGAISDYLDRKRARKGPKKTKTQRAADKLEALRLKLERKRLQKYRP